MHLAYKPLSNKREQTFWSDKPTRLLNANLKKSIVAWVIVLGEGIN